MKHFVFKYPIQLSVGWALFILVLCSMPGRFIPSMHWLDLIAFDKVVHASVFFILTVLLILSAFRCGLVFRSTIALVFLAVCYGVVLEVMQATLFSGRSLEVLDVVAN